MNTPEKTTLCDLLVRAFEHRRLNADKLSVDPAVWQTYQKACAATAAQPVETPTITVPKSVETPRFAEPDTLTIPRPVEPDVFTPPATLGELNERIVNCTRCTLCEKRLHALPGYGGAHAKVVFISDAPEEIEDKQNQPLCGKSGDMLKKMVLAMQLPPGSVYMTYILKCFPGRTHAPTQQNVQKCLEYLYAQLDLIKPKAIVLLGYTAVQYTVKLGPRDRNDTLIGNWLTVRGIPAMPASSPAYLLRLESARDAATLREKKMQTWVALQKVMHYLKTGNL